MDTELFQPGNKHETLGLISVLVDAAFAQLTETVDLRADAEP